MSNLFNCLTAVVTTDARGSRTDFFSPSGNLHHSVPASQAQPVFGRQKRIMHDGNLYTITWQMTPQTPRLPF